LKMSSSSGVLKNSAIYAIAGVLNGAIAFILMPIYTRVLSPDQYATVSIMNSAAGFLTILMMLAMENAITRFHFGYSEEDSRAITGSIFILLMANGVIVSSLLLMFREKIIGLILPGSDAARLFNIALVTTFVKLVYIMYQTVLQAKQKSFEYAKNSIIYVASSAILSIAFLFVFRNRMEAVMAGTLTSTVLLAAISLRSMIKERYIRFAIRLDLLKSGLAYALPFIPYDLVHAFLPLFLKSIVNRSHGLKAVGIYEVALQISTVITVAQLAVNRAYLPWAYERMEKKDHHAIVTVSKDITKISLIICMFISLLGRELIGLLASRQYEDSWIVLPFFTFAAALRGMYYFYSTTISYDMRGAKYITAIAVASNLVHLAIGYAFVEGYGVMSVAAGALIAGFVTLLSARYISGSISETKIPLKPLLVDLFIAMTIVGLGIVPFAVFRNENGGFGLLVYRVGLIFIGTYVLAGSRLRILVERVRAKMKNK
jgi:O-antigen/teichoic acid export membrane protein